MRSLFVDRMRPYNRSIRNSQFVALNGTKWHGNERFCYLPTDRTLVGFASPLSSPEPSPIFAETSSFS